MTFIVFVVILSVLVLIHELGHFLAAKKNGIRVEEFGWGLPPRILGKKWGETIYSINALPFGGFVKLTGEDETNPDFTSDPRSFSSKTPLQRLVVLGAGVFMNLLLAFTIFYFVFSITGFKTAHIPLFFDYQFKFGTSVITSTVVSGIHQGSAAEMAGIELGESIESVDGELVNDVEALKKNLAGKIGTPVNIVLKDLKDSSQENTRTITAMPQSDEKGNSVLGVYLSKTASIEYSTVWEKIFVGPMHSYNVLDYSLFSMGQIVILSFQTRDIEPLSQSVSGPVGIYNVVGNILDYGGSRAWLTLLDYVALMSLSLAFINIMPFPALDGGRMVFVLVEILTKKKVNAILEAKVHQVGIMVLLSLIVIITLKDLFFS